MIKMNTLIKILISISVVFSLVSFTLKVTGVLPDISCDDISKIALTIMSPEVFVGISKIVENTKKTSQDVSQSDNSEVKKDE
jgi:type III secretory pathway component EscR